MSFIPMLKGNRRLSYLDQATGRLMEMTRLQGGLHQAIEAKEGLSWPKKHGPWFYYLPKPL